MVRLERESECVLDRQTKKERENGIKQRRKEREREIKRVSKEGKRDAKD